MVNNLYDPNEAHINQVASGVSLFVSALAMTIAAVEDVPPEDRTRTALLEMLDTAHRMMLDARRESVTAEAVAHSLTILQMVKEGVEQGGDS